MAVTEDIHKATAARGMLLGKEVVMEPSSRRPRRTTARAAFALFAALAFALVRPGAPQAGDGDDPPLSVFGPVKLYGELSHGREGWAVEVRAVNGGGEAEHCRVTAVVADLRDSPMSRVVRAPQSIWSAELTLKMPAGATARDRLTIPAGVAGRLHEVPTSPTRQADELQETITHRLLLEASCLGNTSLG